MSATEFRDAEIGNGKLRGGLIQSGPRDRGLGESGNVVVPRVSGTTILDGGCATSFTNQPPRARYSVYNPSLASVTAPSEAVATCAVYFASTPRV